ncbi:MAG: VCBS repeat-containing protein [Deltaproteobacteria bacterium]|nr:VCBS repeat-containing protein [Deltaproteobacteria bacterium]
MRREASIIKLLLIIAITVIASGCELGGDNGQDKGESDDGLLRFVDSSEGLPRSGQWREGFALYDINGDGYQDILAPPPRGASKEYSTPTLWYGGTDGVWRKGNLKVPRDISYDYGSVSVGDFDGDKIPDLALGIHCKGVKVLRGKGNDSYVDFSEGLPSTDQFRSRAVVSSDFDNDGLTEFAAVSEANFGEYIKKGIPPSGLRVFDLQANRWKQGSLALDAIEQVGLYADQLVTGDVNGDGKIDIGLASLVSSRDLIVWIGDGKGNFAPSNKGLIKEKTYLSIALGDINMDGRDDLIGSIAGFGVKGFKGLKAFLSGPDGFKEMSEGLPKDELFFAICAGDLDKSGGVEVIAVTAQGGLKIFKYVNKQWERARVVGLPLEGLVRPYNIYCKDLNGDGFKDLAMNYASERGDRGGIRVFLNKAESTKGPGKK